MSIDHIVALLIQERDRLNRAIEALSGSTGKRRGRPPKNLIALGDADRSGDSKGQTLSAKLSSAAAGAPPKKRTWSAAQKKAAGLRMKARWAAKKKTAK